ncbi:hypothetical protein D6829_01800 [Candidatus Pacearchaeota archaeon]|nr:MAG: hypothetical protein D6829_01800 [Candidatus Pacearchaeota archaeon]
MEILTILALIILAILLFAAFKIGHRFGVIKSEKMLEEKIPKIRQEAIQHSRAVLAGHFSEQLAPYLPDFPYSPTECRFIGKPVDFIVFQGSDKKQIEEIVFVEVKSGKSSLSRQEKSLRDTVSSKKVRWEEYRVPEDLTKEKKN